MRCYRCGNVLSENEFCTSCGADVKEYKKIIRMSNSLYNLGLEKAKQRDLSGAADVLRRSIKLNKNNINARNLLGLVYFETGEVVQAMAEWVISRNIKPEKNLANSYITVLQSNPNKLDTINQTTKKFNIALEYARQGNDDVAIIQLKKVLNVNPNLIKAHQLLALLYLKREQYEKAKKTLKKALKIDINNTLSKRYLYEVEVAQSKDTTVRPPEEMNGNGKEQLTGFDVIIPNGAYKESNHGTITVLNVVIGILIGIAATYFLITPAKVKSVNTSHNAEIRNLNAKIEEGNTKVSELERQIEALNGEKSDIQSQLTDANSANDAVLGMYDNVIKAAQYYLDNDYVSCAKELSNIDEQNILSATFNAMYTKLKTDSYGQAAIYMYNDSVNKFYSSGTREQWSDTVKGFKQIFEYDYKSTNYFDAADKLCNACILLYDSTLAETPDQAQKTKKNGINTITNLIDKLSEEVPEINEAQLDVYRNYLADLTAR